MKPLPHIHRRDFSLESPAAASRRRINYFFPNTPPKPTKHKTALFLCFNPRFFVVVVLSFSSVLTHEILVGRDISQPFEKTQLCDTQISAHFLHFGSVHSQLCAY